MKYLFRIHQFLFFLNVILFVNPAVGFLCLLPLGVLQVGTSFYLLFQRDNISRNVYRMICGHLIISTLLISSFFLIGNVIPNSWSMITGIILITLCILVAIFFLLILSTNDAEIDLTVKTSKI